DAKRLGTRTAGRVARLAEHFTAADLKALGKFLWDWDIVLDDAMAQMLIDRMETGRLAERLGAIELRAEMALTTGTKFDLLNEARLRVDQPRAPRSPEVPERKFDPPSKMAEDELGAVLEKEEPDWQEHPRARAPGTERGEYLGSTVPEFYNPRLERAFEVK